MSISPPLKTVGGKAYLAEWLHSLAPPHLHRVHPYAGGLGEFWNWPHENVSEVVNDLHQHLINLYKVIADPTAFKYFRQCVSLAPFSEQLWMEAVEFCRKHTSPPINQPNVRCAYHYYIKIRQSFAGGGKSFAPLSRTRLRRQMNEQVSAYLSAVDGLPEIHERLQRVVVLNRPALEVIAQQDGLYTLVYADPPYLETTRTEGLYEHEMSEADHVQLLDLLQTVKGKVMLSGYRSDLYDQKLTNWNRHERQIPNHTSTAESKRLMLEACWCNF